ncbi:MAG: fatty acyl-AMP ligase [Alphaproteobacteria bacterium]
MLTPTPTLDSTLARRPADFATLIEALDYAAQGHRGFNFYSARGELESVLTYTDLQSRSQDFARRMIGLDLEFGSRIALIADTSPEFLAAFFGCQYAGLLPVPLPLPTSFGGKDGYVDQLNKQMQSCRASAVIGAAAMQDLLAQAAVGLDLKLVASHDEVAALPNNDEPLRPQGADDICYLQYSSGSTRFPHGVVISQEAAVTNCRSNLYQGVRLQDDDRMMSWLPFYHDMGLVGAMLSLMTGQVSADYLPTEYFARRPMLWLELMSRNKCTMTYSPTFGYELCARRARPERIAEFDLSAWRVAGLGAEMIRADSMREFVNTFGPAGFPATAFMPSYGLAECTLAVSFAPTGQGIEVDIVDEAKLSEERRAVPADPTQTDIKTREVVNCGIPVSDFDLEIRDDDGNLAPERGIGKIFVRGPSVMSGYYMDPEGTRNVLDDQGWLDTGDMGYMLDGSLYIIGRAKDLIILNGRNHWPQDIEWTVEQVDGLRSGDCAAISVPGHADEEVAMILVQARISDMDERRALVAEIKQRLQKEVGIACRVTLVKPRSLPRTSSGKLSRSKARDKYLAGDLEPLESSDPVPWGNADAPLRAAAGQ